MMELCEKPKKYCEVCNEPLNTSNNARKYCVACAFVVNRIHQNELAKRYARERKEAFNSLPEKEKNRLITIATKKILNQKSDPWAEAQLKKRRRTYEEED